jgi:DNA polymerase-3 subunit gamma/tau
MSERNILTLKYRPRTFDEILIQDHVTHTLARAIAARRFANAYLFAGPRGIGKTTTARILAKSLNCLSSDTPTVTPCGKCSACTEIATSRSLDVLEIDGASNRGIDQIRELRENIKYAPANLRYKVYIIDEVHMLTEPAFNALLKTLEEPPAHAMFILATTAANKMPATIISRCQRFDFRKAAPAEIAARLRWITEQESIKASDAALMAVARRSDGSIRDGESILEQLATYRPDGIEQKDVNELLGLVPSELFFDYTDRLIAAEPTALLELIDRVQNRGYDLFEFYTGLVWHFRNLAFIQAGGQMETLGLLPVEQKRLKSQATHFDRPRLIRVLEILLRAEESAKHTRMPRIVFDYLMLELLAVVGNEATPHNQTKATKRPDPNPKPEAKPAPRRAAQPGPDARPAATRKKRVAPDRPPRGRTTGSDKKGATGGTDDELLQRMKKILGDVEEERH